MSIFGRRKADDSDNPLRPADSAEPIPARTAVYQIRADPATLNGWKLAAAVEGITLAEWMRDCLNERASFILASTSPGRLRKVAKRAGLERNR